MDLVKGVMPMDLEHADLMEDLVSALERERMRLESFYDWYNFAQPAPATPKNATVEQKALAKKARTPLLRLVVEATVEPLRVEGYRPSVEFDKDDDGWVPYAWRAWTLNGMGARQSQVYRDAAIAGYSFVTVVPGEGPDGESMPRMRPVSPRRMYAEYDDPYGDEFPIHAVQDMGRGRFRLFDDQFITDYKVQDEKRDNGETKRSFVRVGEPIEHGAGVCPVVRFENLVDTEGRCVGEIEPYVDVAARFDVTQMDKILVQRHNSWKIMYATGLNPPKDLSEEEQRRTKVRMRQEDMILAGSDVKFGQLDETSMGGFLTALNDELELLSSVSQTPTSVMSGNLVNLSADALAESRIMHTLKLAQRTTNFTVEWGRVLRVACEVGGASDEAKDYMASVVWAEIEVRSLAQTVDAFGKLAAQLEVPPVGLWDKIPGATSSDIARWERLRELKREEDLEIEAILAGIEASKDGAAPDPAGLSTNTMNRMERMESTLPTYENMDKPWSHAARGGARSTTAVKRLKKREIDGDGDGIIGE